MSERVGIEKLSVWPATMAMDMRTLVEARGGDVNTVCQQMMITERSVNPAWEDPVTMGVNAGLRLLTPEDRAAIKLLLVASESGLDQEKSLSTWIQRYLGLPDDCRNLEVKHACYGGTGALELAASWVRGQPRGVKALVITSDQSRAHFHRPYEFVMGAGAVAMMVSQQPDFLALEPSYSGVYTQEVSDLTRPTSRVEAGHSETSLLSYLEAVDITFARYLGSLERAGLEVPKDRGQLSRWLPYHIYHAPFGGITERAHRALIRSLDEAVSASQQRADFEGRVLPSLAHNRRMGGTYASSIFISMVGLVDAFQDAAIGQRVGIYSYGSGSCAEFYSGNFGEAAVAVARQVGLKAALDARKSLTVRGYEEAERERSAWIDCGDYRTSIDGHEDWYGQRYRGRGLLTFRGVSDFVRQYEWS
ncbi:MAG: hydroxymethylglutaryl-CoA synthase [Myxococcota bacterium]